MQSKEDVDRRLAEAEATNKHLKQAWPGWSLLCKWLCFRSQFAGATLVSCQEASGYTS